MSKLRTILKILRHDRNPLARIFKILVMRSPFDAGRLLGITIKIQDYYIRLHPSQLSLAHWFNPNARISDYRFITSYLKKGQTYIDVGANIGTTLIPAAKSVGEDGKTIGFEPHPRIFSYLKDNVSLNNLGNNVELHNCALGNKQGYVDFSEKRADDRNRVLCGGKAMKVPVNLLDDFAEQYSKIDLIKIDVEGYEKFVCDGGAKTLERTECIYFEVSEEHFGWYGYSMKELLRTLSKMRFHLFVIASAGGIKPIDCEYKLPRQHTNVFAIRNTKDFMGRTGWRIHDGVTSPNVKKVVYSP